MDVEYFVFVLPWLVVSYMLVHLWFLIRKMGKKIDFFYENHAYLENDIPKITSELWNMSDVLWEAIGKSVTIVEEKDLPFPVLKSVQKTKWEKGKKKVKLPKNSGKKK